ncbi:FAD-dependent oxidoreductase [bacterium]|nr:FAD-dependent oxidoreductase [bacterium]
MPNNKNYNKVQVLIVGAGPAGLSAAIHIKKSKPEFDVCVIDKAFGAGNHNLSGAVLEHEPLTSLLDFAADGWRESEKAKDVLGQTITNEKILFMPSSKTAFNLLFAVKIAKWLNLGLGGMLHGGDYIVSISKLSKWLTAIARDVGVEVLFGFAAQDIIFDKNTGLTAGVKLIDQGLDKDGNKQPNYIAGDIINADFTILAEGCDGLLTEKFIEKANLERKQPQLFSLGVKELIKISPEQYRKFNANRVIHAMGYPIWTPILGPAMFGGGIIYPGTDNNLAVGMIVGADWKYYDFNPQDALTKFKEHKFVKQFIDGGTVVEAGAKLIPEGGFHAIPRDPQTNSIGKGNCLILGDSAGFVNMLKIRGLHLAIDSGIQAAAAIIDRTTKPDTTAIKYTELIDNGLVGKEMRSAENYRQTIAKFGPTFGIPLSVISNLLPKFTTEEDYKAMTEAKYKLKPKIDFDKDAFTAAAATEHREEEPSHLEILDHNICEQECAPKFGRPCITFCPAGVYEVVNGEAKAANPSNCLHCKTCQRKCPFNNISWTVPEGAGGPRYKNM